MPAGLEDRMATPWTRSSPWSATITGAWSSAPTEDPPETSTRSPAGSRRAASTVARRSGTMGARRGRPPSRRTRASSMSELESTMWVAVGTEPGGSSSSPVITTRTVGRRITGTVARPTDAKAPTSWGRRTRPADSRRCPASISSPIWPTWRPGGTASVTATSRPPEPSTSRATSAMTTASAPWGRGAPVMMRTVSPLFRTSANGRPGIASPIRRKVRGV